jgi:hypothetical protein
VIQLDQFWRHHRWARREQGTPTQTATLRVDLQCPVQAVALFMLIRRYRRQPEPGAFVSMIDQERPNEERTGLIQPALSIRHGAEVDVPRGGRCTALHLGLELPAYGIRLEPNFS